MDVRTVESVNSKDISSQKEIWRQHFKKAGQAVSAIELTSQVHKNLKILLKNVKGPIGVFSNLTGEPCLKALVQELALEWCFPKVNGNQMSFHKSSWDQLSTGTYGVLEPSSDNQVKIEDLSWCLVPGLGFDRQGTRMGRGKAFYDRTFHGHKTNLVGVSFSSLVTTERLPYEGHDVLMNWIVTDKYLLKVAAKKS